MRKENGKHIRNGSETLTSLTLDKQVESLF